MKGTVSVNCIIVNYFRNEENILFLGILEVKINASKLIVKVGNRIEIRCDVIGGPVNLKITWSKTDKLIDNSHHTKVEARERHSRVIIRDVMAEDEGTYYCHAR